VFIHGDLQVVHVLDDGGEASGVGDWSEGGKGDAMYDLATLTLAHRRRSSMSWRAAGAHRGST
jgi:aminoglycoside phosphotransferase (APT) family kinase protein